MSNQAAVDLAAAVAAIKSFTIQGKKFLKGDWLKRGAFQRNFHDNRCGSNQVAERFPEPYIANS